MATIEEAHDSRIITDNGIQLRYIIRGTADELEAQTILLTTAPDTWGAEGEWYRVGRTVEPVSIDTVSPENCIWTGTVTYRGVTAGQLQGETPGLSAFNFDTRGGSKHITHAVASINRYPATGPDAKGGIGVSATGVAGVDIVWPIYNWGETHIIDNSQVTDQYKARLFHCTGKANASAFRGLARGECLFLGASGTASGGGVVEGDWRIMFNFASSPNRTGVTVGAIQGIACEGWQYLWIRYEQKKSGTPPMLVMQPVTAYVEQVYEYDDFALLGI